MFVFFIYCFFEAMEAELSLKERRQRELPKHTQLTAAFDFFGKKNIYIYRYKQWGENSKKRWFSFSGGFHIKKKNSRRGNRLSDMKRDVKQTGIWRGAFEGNF